MKFPPPSLLAMLALLSCGASAGAGIATKDDEGDFPVRGEIPLKNWAKLMEETNTPPIVIPPTSRIAGADNPQSWEWTMATLLQPAFNGYLKPEDAEARAYWVKAARFFLYKEPSEPDAAFNSRLSQVAKDPKLPPGLCLIAARLLHRAGLEEQGLALLPRVVDAPADTPMPPFYRAVAQVRLLLDEDLHPERRRKKPVEDKFFKVLSDSIAKPLPADDLQHTLIAYFGSGPLVESTQGREARFIATYKGSAFPEWLRLTLEGQLERKWAYTVKKAFKTSAGDYDVAAVRQHLKNARQALTHSWELNPASLDTAREMMGVVLMEHELAGKPFDPRAPDELRQWFDRAIAVECDSLPVYTIALNGYDPAYGGSLAKQLAFGRACAETRRFDTNVPSYFSDAVSRVAAALPDWRSLYRQPGIAKLLLETDRARVAKLDDDAVRSRVRSVLAFDAWACGDYALATETFGKMKGADGQVMFLDSANAWARRWMVDPKFVLGDAFCRGGKEKEAYERAGRLLADELPAHAVEAGKLYRQLLATADPAARPLLQADVRLAAFRQVFEKGAWAPLPLEEAQCWRQPGGKAEWHPETKRLRLLPEYRFSKTLFRGRLGARFEMRGHFYNSHGTDREAGGLGILNGHTPMGAGSDSALDWWTVRVDYAGKGKNSVWQGAGFLYFGDEKKEPLEWKPEYSFVYRCDRGKVTFAIDGKEFLHEVEMGGEEASTGTGAVGFSMLGQGAGSVTELWDVEVRKLFDAQ